ncbi:ribonuclease E/G [Hyphomonas sp.]|uniref:ribonuclease E/G n=1 Tax=Hyphomonas sp. TaxID=87 RepID=UPI00391937FB
MPVGGFLREQSIGETRWVALGTDGLPVALYLERETDAARRARLGERLEARVRKLDTATGGAFVDLGAQGEAFLRISTNEALTEGAAVSVDVVAEARRGKLARVALARGDAGALGAARWRETLVGGAEAAIEDRAAGDAEVAAAFEDALNARATLPGGGVMQIARTEALVAADIDTSGRAARGGRSALALGVNLAAARELARQAHLRGLGGLMVLDCVAPLDTAAGGQVRAAFLEAWRAISTRQVKALAPSAFGLMEASADWQTAPLEDRLAEAAETAALAGLRQLEAAARQARMTRLTLALPRAAAAWLAASGLGAEARLAEKYGGRLTITGADRDDPDVTETP